MEAVVAVRLVVGSTSRTPISERKAGEEESPDISQGG